MRLFFLIFIFQPLFFLAQEQKSKIIYYNNVDLLLKKYENIQLSNGGIKGYRIQISSESKKSIINDKRKEFVSKFPEIAIYIKYKEPYYKLRIGNFRTKLNAEKVKQKIRKSYPGAHIVSDIINKSDFED